MSKNNSSINKRTVLKLASGIPNIKAVFKEVSGYNDKISQKSLESLLHEPTARNTWETFIDGINNHPNTILIGTKRLSDFPQLIYDVQLKGFSGFYQWLQKNLNNKHVPEQAVMRNIFHFFEYTLRMDGELPSDALEIMRQEFKEPDIHGQTLWVSRFFNGLQTCVIEVYLASEIASQYLD